jgi:hypothetical protein
MGFAHLLDVRALDNCSKHICQFCQRHSGDLVALHTGNITVTNSILNQDDFVSLLECLAGSGGDADVCHVAGQDKLLNTPLLQCLVERRLFERAREVLPDLLFSVLINGLVTDSLSRSVHV